MQTFIPLGPDFQANAACLDRQRLGKQRVETLQILQTLTGQSKGWANHPAVKMWAGYETALYRYGAAVCAEWINRGYQDTCLAKMTSLMLHRKQRRSSLPWWLSEHDVLISHQSNLIRKFPAHYGRLFPGVPNDLPYVWPDSLAPNRLTNN